MTSKRARITLDPETTPETDESPAPEKPFEREAANGPSTPPPKDRTGADRKRKSGSDSPGTTANNGSVAAITRNIFTPGNLVKAAVATAVVVAMVVLFKRSKP